MWKQYAKAIVAYVIAAVGAGLTAAQGIVHGDSQSGAWITIALAFVTALSTSLGVYATTNARGPAPVTVTR